MRHKNDTWYKGFQRMRTRIIKDSKGRKQRYVLVGTYKNKKLAEKKVDNLRNAGDKARRIKYTPPGLTRSVWKVYKHSGAK
jgi:hypothetical protein